MHIRPENDRPNHEIRECEDEQIIEITSTGFFDEPTLRASFERTREVVTRWRRAGRPVRVLLDAITMTTQSAAHAALMQKEIASIYQRDDRVAILVASSLVKLQLRRMETAGIFSDFFVSKSAARLWLGSDRPPLSADASTAPLA